jgi:hypothetical protein
MLVILTTARGAGRSAPAGYSLEPVASRSHTYRTAAVNPLATIGTVEAQAEVRSPTRSRSASNSLAKEVSLVRRKTLNWPSARWPVSTIRRR